MKTVSIFNHVLGPVMRGPSSSHTAGAFHIGCMARSILGGTPRRAVLAFDPAGSYCGHLCRAGSRSRLCDGTDGQAADRGIVLHRADGCGAGRDGDRLSGPDACRSDHPNTVDMDLTAADGSALRLVARSIGGGEVEITSLDGRPVLFNGSAYETLVEVPADKAGAARGAADGRWPSSGGQSSRLRKWPCAA